MNTDTSYKIQLTRKIVNETVNKFKEPKILIIAHHAFLVPLLFYNSSN